MTVPLGEDIGFLPGTEEKDDALDGAIEDNLDVLKLRRIGRRVGTRGDAGLGSLAHQDQVASIHARRALHQQVLIIDEAQNLTPKQMKTLVTPPGPGTKVVCLGISRRSTHHT